MLEGGESADGRDCCGGSGVEHGVGVDLDGQRSCLE